MKILLYTRPHTKEYLYSIAKNIDQSVMIESVSDFKGDGDFWMGDFLYTNTISENLYFNENELYDIINRCRYLRTLSYEMASKLITNYACGINYILDRGYHFIVSEIVDNYCMDIIYREATKRNIKVIAPMGTFIDGYMRFTVKGEVEELQRNVSDEEVSDVLDKLLSNHFKGRVGGLGYSNENKRYYYFYRRILIEKIYNPLRRVVTKDRNNSLYNTYLYNSINVKKYLGKKVKRNFIDLDNFVFQDNDVYFPLHCTPEATTDYFCDSSKFGYYEETILEFLSNSTKNVRYLVKEHPTMYGIRKLDFYENMKTFENVVLLNPFDDSNTILQNINTVVVCTGSIGVESLIRNKRVMCLSSNYYSSIHPNAHVIKYLSDEELNLPIVEYDNRLFMKKLLSFHVPIQMYSYDQIMKTDFNLLGKYIREYFIYEKV
ncbi:capsular polysaccharide export protein, LipB/KpsS family [Candidatus Stoquefichus sp. SB1]|uniref:capsular polysaccharide export protein, LipB/KpsS family n=1 Tax=Candidatus Stoquefichus sp. SB1 TaxID=1658109 RepID=UPI00067EEBF4|nr:hypothetical protein [Candidatus Stoquefichus sp. SB1]